MIADELRCETLDKKPTAPLGFTVEAQRNHPTYRYYLLDGARCELDRGHPGPHRCGLLVWHDPPLVVLERDLPAPAIAEATS